MVDYPFPLRSGQIAHVRLPARVEREDAERMSASLRTLVIDPRRELPPGEEEAA
jgi:hypothetical protein